MLQVLVLRPVPALPLPEKAGRRQNAVLNKETESDKRNGMQLIRADNYGFSGT